MASVAIIGGFIFMVGIAAASVPVIPLGLLMLVIGFVRLNGAD